MQNSYVYDDGVVKGVIHISGTKIEKLYVEPQFQGQGIGAALLQYAVQKRQAVSLWVLEYNTRGIAFYERNGFRLTGEKRIEDEVVPLLKMERVTE
ncbi:MAG: GNAT family N-acetyltransferase [Ruminococcus callidus]